MDKQKARNTNSPATMTGQIGHKSKDADRNKDADGLLKCIRDVKSLWKQLDFANSHLLIKLCDSLAGTQHELITKEVVALLGPVFACGESELVLSSLKEIETICFDSQKHKTRNGDQENVLKCLLSFVKMLAEYHQLCLNFVSSAIGHLTISLENQGNKELLRQIKLLELIDLPMTLQSQAQLTSGKKTPQAGYNSLKSEKHGVSLKASLFSFFERKNDPGEGSSSFYVDIDKQKNEHESNNENEILSSCQSDVYCKDLVTNNNHQSELLIDFSMDANSLEVKNLPSYTTNLDGSISPPKDTSILDRPISLLQDTSNLDMLVSLPVADANVSGNGHIASHAELDSVINLLSGVGLCCSSMPTIAAQLGTTHLQVPNITRASLSSSKTDCIEERLLVRSKGQRRSEGSINVSELYNTGHNTWPGQHRASFSSGQLTTPHINDIVNQVLYPYRYDTNFHSTTMPPGGADHFHVPYGMGCPDPKLNRTWPVSNLTQSGCLKDSVSSTGVDDSDDLSDDSSVGDQLQASTLFQYQATRYKQDRPAFVGGNDQGLCEEEVKHHSLEDLLECHSNIWQHELQPWSQPNLGMDLVGSSDQFAYHRPISMQMSDPLSWRNIWRNSGSDFPLQAQQQSKSVHSGLGQMFTE